MMSDEPDSNDGSIVGERPFPWWCPRCRTKTVWRVTIPYQCKRKLGGESVTLEISALAVPQCANCGELVFDYVAESQINDAFQQMVNAAATGGSATVR